MSNAFNAYKKSMTLNLSGRKLEATVLTKAAQVLKSAQDEWRVKGHFKKLDQALRFNQRLWTVFQDELLKKDNPLPKQIKDDLLRLSFFVDKRTFEIMREPKPEKLDILININLNIAAGLRDSPTPE